MKEVRLKIEGKEEKEGELLVKIKWVSLRKMREMRKMEEGEL
jgi:hypothetical protein